MKHEADVETETNDYYYYYYLSGDPSTRNARRNFTRLRRSAEFGREKAFSPRSPRMTMTMNKDEKELHS